MFKLPVRFIFFYYSLLFFAINKRLAFVLLKTIEHGERLRRFFFFLFFMLMCVRIKTKNNYSLSSEDQSKNKKNLINTVFYALIA